MEQNIAKIDETERIIWDVISKSSLGSIDVVSIKKDKMDSTNPCWPRHNVKIIVKNIVQVISKFKTLLPYRSTRG